MYGLLPGDAWAPPFPRKKYKDPSTSNDAISKGYRTERLIITLPYAPRTIAGNLSGGNIAM
jgi:hypothetical protein